MLPGHDHPASLAHGGGAQQQESLHLCAVALMQLCFPGSIPGAGPCLPGWLLWLMCAASLRRTA